MAVQGKFITAEVSLLISALSVIPMREGRNDPNKYFEELSKAVSEQTRLLIFNVTASDCRIYSDDCRVLRQ